MTLAADNVTADPGTGGAEFRTFSDGTDQWPAAAVSYITGGSAGAWTLQAVDATHGLPVAVVGTVPVSAAALPLPSGAATAANQATEITGLAAILSALGGTLTVSVSALAAGANNIGQVCATGQATGGDSIYSVISSGASNQDSAAVKGSAGTLYGYSLFNTTSTARYAKFYNKASGATSSDTPVLRIYLPPTGGANVSFPNGLAFGTGICIRLTTGAADSDTGACSANDVLANVDYK